jgi:uncharacterized protein (DUF2141 family)
MSPKNSILLVALLLNTGLYAQNQDAVLQLIIENMIPGKGHLMVRIADASGNTITERREKAQDAPSQTLKFELPTAKYAIQVFQDKNNNLEIDRILLGPPSEPYGFSNNARGMFGPPELEEQLFKVSANTVHRIRIY